jgi:hypothetical protein
MQLTIFVHLQIQWCIVLVHFREKPFESFLVKHWTQYE